MFNNYKFIKTVSRITLLTFLSTAISPLSATLQEDLSEKTSSRHLHSISKFMCAALCLSKASGLTFNLTDLGDRGINITGTGWLGQSVSSAGDVNRDGFDDFIIGAPELYSWAGAAYLIYGSSNLTNKNLTYSLGNDLIFYGSYINPSLPGVGFSVSGGGDINGDGYSDFIIGNPAYEYMRGITYSLYGNNSLKSLNLSLPLEKSGTTMLGGVTYSPDYYNSWTTSRAGEAVSNAGDINKDGYADILIGAPCFNPITREYKGAVYVVYGNESLGSINLGELRNQGFNITGNGAIGESVSGAGDVNGDGYPDILFGASNYNSTEGRSYVIYGGKNLRSINLDNELVENGFIISGSLFTGFSVSGVGDVNKDGYDDMLISSKTNTSLATCYLIYGGNNLTNINLNQNLGNKGVKFIGPKTDIFSVSGAGDFNGDGYPDILIGSAANLRPYQGNAYLIYGGNNLIDMRISNGLGNKGITFIGGSYTVGASVSGAGDVNADGYDDILIGSTTDDVTYLVYGFPNTLNSSPTSFPSFNPLSYPSLNPLSFPSSTPLSFPSVIPSSNPTVIKNKEITNTPTNIPTKEIVKTDDFNEQPTSFPTNNIVPGTSKHAANNNNVYIYSSIVSFFVGIPLVLFVANYIKNLYKKESNNENIENPTSENVQTIEMKNLIKTSDLLSTDKV